MALLVLGSIPLRSGKTINPSFDEGGVGEEATRAVGRNVKGAGKFGLGEADV